MQYSAVGVNHNFLIKTWAKTIKKTFKILSFSSSFFVFCIHLLIKHLLQLHINIIVILNSSVDFNSSAETLQVV